MRNRNRPPNNQLWRCSAEDCAVFHTILLAALWMILSPLNLTLGLCVRLHFLWGFFCCPDFCKINPDTFWYAKTRPGLAVWTGPSRQRTSRFNNDHFCPDSSADGPSCIPNLSSSSSVFIILFFLLKMSGPDSLRHRRYSYKLTFELIFLDLLHAL